MNPRARIPMGVIGCGTVAQYGHLPAIAGTRALSLVAVADTDPGTRIKVAAQYGVPGVADYGELLKRSDIEAVSICTRVQTHDEIVAAALKAGKHVLCEKPFADTPRHCRQLVGLGKKHRRMIGVNFEYRFDEDVRAMQECIASGEIGKPQVLRFIYNWSAHGSTGPAANRRAAFLQNGGGSMDCGVHYVDLARLLSGSEFEKISVMGQWVEPHFRYPGHVLAQGRMRNGVLVFIEVSFVYTHTSQTRTFFMQHELIGERGIVSWQANPPTPVAHTAPSLPFIPGTLQILTTHRTEVKSVEFTKHFAETYQEWARCLARGTMQGSRLATGEDGSRAAATMWRILSLADRERGRQAPPSHPTRKPSRFRLTAVASA